MKSKLLTLLTGAAWLVGTAAAVRIVDTWLGKNPMTGALIGAIVVDLAVRRAGVSWLGEEEGAALASQIAKRAARGAAFALAAVLAITLMGAASGAAEAALVTPSVAVLIALVRSLGVAVRDELLFRGLVLHIAEKAGIRPAFASIFAAAAGAAAIALAVDVTPEAVALAFTSGLLFAEIWRHGGGAYAAIGAHVIWNLLLSSGLRGGLAEVIWARGTLTEGAKAEGPGAWIGAAVCLLLALSVSRVFKAIEKRRAQAA